MLDKSALPILLLPDLDHIAFHSLKTVTDVTLIKLKLSGVGEESPFGVIEYFSLY